MSQQSARSTIGRGSAHTVPWVTFGLVAVCICVFSVTQWSARQAQATAERELQTAIDYLMARPYLEPGEVLASRLDPTLLEQRRLLERQARVRRAAPPIPKRVQQRQKQKLDDLVASAYAGIADLTTQRWGFRASDFAPATFVSHIFLHENSWHLIIGLFLFLLLGFHLEVSWGSGVFAAFIPLAAVVSAGVFASGNREFDAPYIGISGVVAALLAAFSLGFRSIWKSPVYPFLMISGAMFLVLPVRFGYGWTIASGLEQTVVLVSNQGASYWAAGGGFVFGLFWQFMISQFRAGDVVGEGNTHGSGRIANPLLEKAISARSAGRANEAYDAISRLLAEQPDNHEALLVMWDIALDFDKPESASAAMIRAIRDEVKRGDAVAAVDHWFDLENRGRTEDAEPALLIRLASMLEQRNQRSAAISALQLALDRSEGQSAAVVATRVARASRDLDADTARAAAWRALGSTDLDLEERQALETLLESIGAEIDFSPTGPGAAAGADRALDRALDLAPESDPTTHFQQVQPVAQSDATWVDPILSGADARGPAASEATPVELADLVLVEGSWSPPARGHEPASCGAAAIDLDVVLRKVRCLSAVPIEIAHGGLRIEVDQGLKRRLPLTKVEAIAVAAVAGLGAKPVIVIDLVMNWQSSDDGLLKVIRIRGDRFDVRRFATKAGSAADALREFTAELLRVSGATPLPDAESAAGMPFASYDDLATYHGAVLGAASD